MNVARLTTFAKTTTARLALSYLAIVMLMSIGFSVVFYNASSHELGRQLPPPSAFGVRRFDEFEGSGPRVDEFFAQRIQEGRRNLLLRLIVLNLLALTAGSILSYYLARRTLKPIEATIEAQAQFVSDASHELRTPLTTLRTTNEVALRKPILASGEVKDLLRHNVAEVAKLQVLTDGLLKLARQDNNDLITQAVSLQEVASEAMNAVVNGALAKRITIEDTVPDSKVLANKAGLTQALVIILDNAVKYSPEEGVIRLKGGQHGKHGFIAVCDEGPGIRAVDLPHIFDRFYRADQSRNKQKVDGYGIGLALAKKILDQHNGEITAVNNQRKGSTFTLRVPLAK